MATLLLAGCGQTQQAALSPSPHSSHTAVAVPVAADGELPRDAVERLWPDMQDWMMGAMGRASIEGARPGPPVFASELYSMSEPLLVRWVLPDDARAVTGGMFAAMSPTSANDSSFLVEVAAGEKAVAEFLVGEGADGRWEVAEMTEGSGQAQALSDATRTLRRALGDGTAVRAALLLPSGLAFAVGDNEGREAAVYLTFVNHGAGVGSFDKRLPRSGRLFTPEQLEALLTR